jgi:hypothetical protein
MYQDYIKKEGSTGIKEFLLFKRSKCGVESRG